MYIVKFIHDMMNGLIFPVHILKEEIYTVLASFWFILVSSFAWFPGLVMKTYKMCIPS